MAKGYLYIETSESHPGLIRLHMSHDDNAPNLLEQQAPGADPAIRHMVRFFDVDAARMHTYNELKHHLIDVDSNLFKVVPEEAVAAVESVELSHERIFLDPILEESSGERITELEKRSHKRHRLVSKIWQLVGWLALIWLTLLVFSGALPF